MNPAFAIIENSLYERSRGELVSIILRMQTAMKSRDADFIDLINLLEWHKRQLFRQTLEKRVIYDENVHLN